MDDSWFTHRLPGEASLSTHRPLGAGLQTANAIQSRISDSTLMACERYCDGVNILMVLVWLKFAACFYHIWMWKETPIASSSSCTPLLSSSFDSSGLQSGAEHRVCDLPLAWWSLRPHYFCDMRLYAPFPWGSATLVCWGGGGCVSLWSNSSCRGCR